MRLVGFVIALFAAGVTLFNVIVYIGRARVVRRLSPCEEIGRLGWLDAAWCFAEECVATARVVAAAPLGWLVGREPGRTQNIGSRTQSTEHRAQSTEHRAQSTEHRAQSTQHSVHSAEHGTHTVSSGDAAQLTRGPVVLVHGWGLNGGSMLLLRRRLLRDGWGPVSCFNYLSRKADIETAAAELATYIERVTALSAQPITLIGHSLGGLVIRYYARHYPAPNVRRLVTLGTPHHGTELAQRWFDKLTPRSPLILELKRGDRTPRKLDVITIFSTFDAVILPPANGIYPGAFNIQLNNVGHNALLTSARVYGLIAENLAAPFEAAPRAEGVISKPDGFVGWTG